MSTRIAINGFGRIGRLVLRSAKKEGLDDLDFVAVNDLTDSETLAHLFRYDSVHGRYPGEVEVTDAGLVIDGDEVRVLSEKDPGALPWEGLDIDVVIESTGIFRKPEDARRHLDAGARKVVLSAPPKGDVLTVVMGVNHRDYDPERHDIVSNASCTTNCLAPVVKVLREAFGFRRGFMTTIHSYTNNQNILDLPHKDLRRARAAAVSMIPTSTGAAKATGLVIPEVDGKLDGIAIRVPTPDVSIVDLVADVEEETTRDAVNDAFRSAAAGELAGILAVGEDPLVSVDYVGHPASSIVDAENTDVIDGRMVKVLSWYDNEWGYATRCAELAAHVAERLPARAGA